MSRSDDKSCRLIHLCWRSWPTWSQEKKASCLFVCTEGNNTEMSHECSITNDPTHTTAAEPFCKAEWATDLPQMPGTSPRHFLELMVSDRLSNLAPRSSWEAYTQSQQKKPQPPPLFAPCMVWLSTSFPCPRLLPAPMIIVALNLPSSHEAAAESGSECMQMSTNQREGGDFCWTGFHLT